MMHHEIHPCISIAYQLPLNWLPVVMIAGVGAADGAGVAVGVTSTDTQLQLKLELLSTNEVSSDD